MSEKDFDQALIKKLRSSGLFTLDLRSLGGGTPDFMVSNKNKFIFVENKEKINPENVAIRNHFTKYQPVWYLNYLTKTETENVFCLYRFYQNGQKWFFLFRMNFELASKIKDICFSEIKNYTHSCVLSKSLNVIIEYIRSYLS